MNSSTPLYIQVEEAINEFKTNVTKLRSQQTQIDDMMVKGTEALGNMLGRVALIDQLKDEVDAQMQQLEQFRHKIGNESAKHQQESKLAIQEVRTTSEERRLEFLALIRELRHALQKSEQEYKAGLQETKTRLTGLHHTLDNSMSDIQKTFKARSRQQDAIIVEVSNRLESLELSYSRRIKLLTGAVLLLGFIAILSILL